MKTIIFCILYFLLLPSAWAQSFVFESNVDEARYEAFTKALRCLKCEHQSIDESQSDFSKDLKQWLFEQITAHRSDDEIKRMLKERFGDRIFFEPPWQLNTYFLWVLPLFLLFLGLWYWYRGMQSCPK